MIGRVNTGGGGSGGVLTVTAPEGSTIEVSKDTRKYTKSGGVAVFKGLETGTWTVTIKKDGLTATQQIEIDADYELTMNYFTATIQVTFPTDCTSVTCTKGDTVLSVPGGELSKGRYAFSVHEAGEWTLYCTNGVDTDTDVVNVTEEKGYSVVLSFLYYLYNTGDECTAVTGGWKARKQGSRGTFTKKETSIYVQGESDNGMNAATSRAIDLTPFSTAKIRLVKVSSGGSGNVFFTTNSEYSESGSGTRSLSATSKPEVVSLDIRSLNGSYYAVFCSLNGIEIEFDQMWLEE